MQAALQPIPLRSCYLRPVRPLILIVCMLLVIPAIAHASELGTAQSVLDKLPAPPRSSDEATKRCSGGKSAMGKPLHEQLRRAQASIEKAQRGAVSQLRGTGPGISKEADEAHNEVANLIAQLTSSAKAFQSSLTSERGKWKSKMMSIEQRKSPEQDRCKGDASCKSAVMANLKEKRGEAVDAYLTATARDWDEFRLVVKQQVANITPALERMHASKKPVLEHEARTAEQFIIQQLELLLSEAAEDCANAASAMRR